MSGPLKGLKVIEMAGAGPTSFGAMMLADMGASVLRIAGQGAPSLDDPRDVTTRGRQTLPLALSRPESVEAFLLLVESADVLIEGHRPGVMEGWGLPPEVCLARNPRLVYARQTGWGQYGPLAHTAGNDINHIAISGALHAMGRDHETPAPPLNYLGDAGGGGMLLTFGVLSALYEVQRSGHGQVVDAACVDGAALMSSALYGFKAAGQWSNQRGANLLDGGAPFYDTYACADGKYVAIGAIEPAFYARLLELCGVQDQAFDAQMDAARWPLLKLRMADVFRTRTRDEWCRILEGSDACFSPVLDWDEAPKHPHNRARETFVSVDGVVQPAPAPRFSRTPAAPPRRRVPQRADHVLRDWGLSEAGLAHWRGSPGSAESSVPTDGR